MKLFNHGCILHRLPCEMSHLHDLLHHLIHQNEQIINQQEIIMSTLPTTTDLDNAIGTVESAIAKIGTDLKNALADLEAKISAAPPQTFDPTPEIARLKAAADALTSLDTTVAAADPGASTPPVTPPASVTGDAGATSSTGADTGAADGTTTTSPA